MRAKLTQTPVTFVIWTVFMRLLLIGGIFALIADEKSSDWRKLGFCAFGILYGLLSAVRVFKEGWWGTIFGGQLRGFPAKLVGALGVLLATVSTYGLVITLQHL